MSKIFSLDSSEFIIKNSYFCNQIKQFIQIHIKKKRYAYLLERKTEEFLNCVQKLVE